jgi:cell division protein FtsB
VIARPKGAGGRSTTHARRALWRVVLLTAVIAALLFAVQGGEYGTTDLVAQRRHLAQLDRDVAALQQRVDSLSAWKKAVETDPVVQERIAREKFGMVRGNKEFLYRIASPADTSR